MDIQATCNFPETLAKSALKSNQKSRNKRSYDLLPWHKSYQINPDLLHTLFLLKETNWPKFGHSRKGLPCLVLSFGRQGTMKI